MVTPVDPKQKALHDALAKKVEMNDGKPGVSWEDVGKALGVITGLPAQDQKSYGHGEESRWHSRVDQCTVDPGTNFLGKATGLFDTFSSPDAVLAALAEKASLPAGQQAGHQLFRANSYGCGGPELEDKLIQDAAHPAPPVATPAPKNAAPVRSSKLPGH